MFEFFIQSKIFEVKIFISFCKIIKVNRCIFKQICFMISDISKSIKNMQTKENYEKFVHIFILDFRNRHNYM